jgi:hypothetical protein
MQGGSGRRTGPYSAGGVARRPAIFGRTVTWKYLAFLGLLDENGEVGKKLVFCCREMNREANTSGASASADRDRITEVGLAMKSDIEKVREQVQNIE